jgi:hypothetical protein
MVERFVKGPMWKRPKPGRRSMLGFSSYRHIKFFNSLLPAQNALGHVVSFFRPESLLLSENMGD